MRSGHTPQKPTVQTEVTLWGLAEKAQWRTLATPRYGSQNSFCINAGSSAGGGPGMPRRG